jgi:hypothetical protein
MDLARMLEACGREQWSVADVDLSRPPRPMSRDDEIAIVQYFTDMSGIERLAGYLFEEQRKRADDPVLKAIFASFVTDEVRHSHVAQLLADHYDVHKYRIYQANPHLVAFTPRFVELVSLLSPEIANVYITTGEIILDVALLRSIADKVDDDTVRDAMARINRDESRHIAVDFERVEYYASDAWEQALANEPSQPLKTQLRAYLALVRVLFHARPFFREVFFAPMDACDPSGKRIREAFKRVQLLAAKPRVARRPFVKFMNRVRAAYDSPLGGVLGPLCVRIAGVDPRVLTKLHTEEEARHARDASYDQLAAETLALKLG